MFWMAWVTAVTTDGPPPCAKRGSPRESRLFEARAMSLRCVSGAPDEDESTPTKTMSEARRRVPAPTAVFTVQLVHWLVSSVIVMSIRTASAR